MDTPLLIAGLGNPGAQYAKNRHNAGFIVVDEIHAYYNIWPLESQVRRLAVGGRSGWAQGVFAETPDFHE